jgi:hypothetical protein
MKPRNPGKWQDAVQAVASGETLLAWSQRTGSSYATARSWSCTPKFKAEVLALQAAAVESTIGKLRAGMPELADELVGIGKHGRSESTRVQAIQATIDNMIKLESHVKLRAEVAELHEKVALLIATQAGAQQPRVVIQREYSPYEKPIERGDGVKERIAAASGPPADRRPATEAPQPPKPEPEPDEHDDEWYRDWTK